MRLRYLALSILVFIAQIAVAEVLAQDADDAGVTLTHPGAGEKNQRLIDTYTDDHGCSCSALGGTHALRGWAAGLAFAGALGARAWRRRANQLSRK